MLRDNSESKVISTPLQSMFFSSKPALSLNQMCIAFDIDDTLASKVERESFRTDKSYIKLAKEQFPEHIIPITLNEEIYDHVLSPGAIEAVQYLLKAGCRLALYSNGIDERNQKFKTELLKRALSPGDFKKYEDQVKVFSREKHFLSSTEDRQPELRSTRGNQKKDLNFVIDAFAESGIQLSLDQIILVDDDLSWMLKGQEKNFLKVPACCDIDMRESLSILLNRNNINHIFYAIGLVSTILKSDKPLDTLFNLQFRDPKEGSWSKNKEYYYDLNDEMQYYQIGLEALRTVNKDLQLIDAEYVKHISSSQKASLERSFSP